MKAPAIQRRRRSRRSRHGERGITIALVAIAMVSIIAVAMLAIDLVTLFLAREEAQRSADTAALAAARIISVSGITGTATTDTTDWQNVCGPSGIATQAALATAGENSVSNTSADTVHVSYAVGTGVLQASNEVNDCSSLGAGAAVNPMVVVTVQRHNLPTFFSRYFGYGGQSVTSTAVAEVFNPSASENNTNGGTTAVTPVQPRCVKPWIVPNLDPVNTGLAFVSLADGGIVTPGIVNNGGPGGVIGETFWLLSNCAPGANCNSAGSDNPPIANTTNGGLVGNPLPAGKNLEYVPGDVASQPVAVPSCAASGTGTNPLYIQAVAGCDQSTDYQCGQVLSSNSPAVDLNENPGGATGDTAMGLACVVTNPQSALPLAGQDTLVTTTYPFTIMTGSANPLKLPATTQVMASNQIVSLPIYDSANKIGKFTNGAPGSQFAVVGFLQVFINQIDANGNVQVTVLNVAGCGDAGGTNSPVTGSSPVPIRLITPP